MKLKNKSSFYALPKRTSVPLGEPLHSLRFFNLKDMEIWKDIHGYEGLYQVSNFGRVKRLKREKLWRGTKVKIDEKIMSISKDRSGYFTIQLYNNNIDKRHRVHRLVASAFIGVSELQVNHIDGIKTNNNINNLEYVTASENIKHYIENNIVIYKQKQRLLDLRNNKIYDSIRQGCRELYKNLGYKSPESLKTAIKFNSIKFLIPENKWQNKNLGNASDLQ